MLKQFIEELVPTKLDHNDSHGGVCTLCIAAIGWNNCRATILAKAEDKEFMEKWENKLSE